MLVLKKLTIWAIPFWVSNHGQYLKGIRSGNCRRFEKSRTFITCVSEEVLSYCWHPMGHKRQDITLQLRWITGSVHWNSKICLPLGHSQGPEVKRVGGRITNIQSE